MEENHESLLFNFNDFEFETEETHNFKKATKQEKTDLLEFIGGFEKWSILSDDCKMYVVGFLDYWTRCKLSLCSKKDHEIVKETILYITKGVRPENDGVRMKPKHLAELFKSGFEQKHSDQATIDRITLKDNFIQIHTVSNFIRTWKFHQKLDECIIRSKSSLDPEFCCSNTFSIQNGKTEKEFLKIAKKVMLKCSNTVHTLEIGMEKNVEKGIVAKFGTIKHLIINHRSEEPVKFWLDKLNENDILESLSLYTVKWWYYCYRKYPFDDIAHPSVVKAKNLKMAFHVDITDEQFLSLEASRMAISTDTLSIDTLFEFIRRWFNDEMNDEFVQCLIWTKTNYRSMSSRLFSVFNAVEHNYRSREIANYTEFFKKFEKYGQLGNFYQINKGNDQNKSISVLISTNSFLVLRTGFPCIRDGQPGVKLVFPNDILDVFD
ncbi:hypothetical protein GCK72_009745 [Caenorhabditis remanei]|uniref:F-box domain-containing protein n=1 Tax=Caenorhabditis remanei TaxID=31234 RepID=A0A6A5H3D4_CAERE|nr:hypothetical protein GCK72_009745 [Caenorhabditis remanei]KAF1761489.1 hypothetical protein GCK72_009745 [Caenorhabditis remanei]